MRRETYYRGAPGVKWGIWNTAKKCFQFGICEDTPMLAEARLFQKIGDDARRWRFEVRRLPKTTSSKTVKVPDGVYVQDEDGQGWHFIEEAKP